MTGLVIDIEGFVITLSGESVQEIKINGITSIRNWMSNRKLFILFTRNV
jgi:hypothetical protein